MDFVQATIEWLDRTLFVLDSSLAAATSPIRADLRHPSGLVLVLAAAIFLFVLYRAVSYRRQKLVVRSAWDIIFKANFGAATKVSALGEMLENSLRAQHLCYEPWAAQGHILAGLILTAEAGAKDAEMWRTRYLNSITSKCDASPTLTPARDDGSAADEPPAAYKYGGIDRNNPCCEIPLEPTGECHVLTPRRVAFVDWRKARSSSGATSMLANADFAAIYQSEQWFVVKNKWGAIGAVGQSALAENVMDFVNGQTGTNPTLMRTDRCPDEWYDSQSREPLFMVMLSDRPINHFDMAVLCGVAAVVATKDAVKHGTWHLHKNQWLVLPPQAGIGGVTGVCSDATLTSFLLESITNMDRAMAAARRGFPIRFQPSEQPV